MIGENAGDDAGATPWLVHEQIPRWTAKIGKPFGPAVRPDMLPSISSIRTNRIGARERIRETSSRSRVYLHQLDRMMFAMTPVAIATSRKSLLSLRTQR